MWVFGVNNRFNYCVFFIWFLGIGRVSRKFGCLVKFIVIINIKEDVIIIKIKSIFKNNEIFFKLGEEFEEIILVGRKIKVRFSILF